MRYDDIYIKPFKSTEKIEWSDWQTGFDPQKTIEENMLEFGDVVFSETWGKMVAALSFESMGVTPHKAINIADRPVVYLHSPDADVYADFDLRSLLLGGVLGLIEDGYLREPEYASAVRDMRNLFAELVKIIDDELEQNETKE